MKPIIAGLCAALSLWTAPAAQAQQPQDEDAIKLALATKIIARVQTQQMTDALEANVKAFVDALNRAKPSGAKGTYVKKISLSSTMGPGFKIDPASLNA